MKIFAKYIVMMLLGAASILAMSAFSCNPSGSTSFTVHIEGVILADDGSTVNIGGISGIGVNASWIQDVPGTTSTGTSTGFFRSTDTAGNILAISPRVPAQWSIAWADPQCINFINDNLLINPGDFISYPCVTLEAAPFTVNPNPVDENNLVPMSLQGTGLDTTYGMPEVDFYTVNGVYLGSRTASFVSADNTTLTVDSSILSGLYNSSYAVVIKNVQSNGVAKIISAGRFQLTGNPRPIAPPPPPPRCTARTCLPQS